MLSQGQFFDTTPYTQRTNRMPSSGPMPPSPIEAAHDYLHTGRMPVEGTDARQARKLLNTVRVDMGGATARNMGTTAERTEDYGVPRMPGGFYEHEDTWVPERFANHEWRKFGNLTEVPYNRIVSAQGAVTKERVDELRKMPGSGTDPRFSGAALQELPVGVNAPTSIGPVTVLHNGNHRVMAERSKQQPELFHQMRTVDAPTTADELTTKATGLNNYRIERAARMGVARDSVLNNPIPMRRDVDTNDRFPFRMKP